MEIFSDPYADRLTAEQRRESHPPEKSIIVPGKPKGVLFEDLPDWEADLKFEHGYHETVKGEKLFYFYCHPKELSKATKIIVFVHGYTDHVGWQSYNAMVTHAKLYNAIVVGCDNIGHGRSDGMFVLVNSWFDLTDSCTDFVERCVFPLREQWNKESGKQLKTFGHGESMGGGAIATMCINKPSLFDGVILSAPMVAVDKNIYPPWIVVQILKNVVLPVLPTAAIIPSKDIDDFLFTDPDMIAERGTAPFGGRGCKPRVATGNSLAFEGPEWMTERMNQFDTPFLIIHSADDKVTDPKLSQQLYEEAKAKDKTIKFYDGSAHADMLHGGPKMKELMERCYNDVNEWMTERC